ncbi:MAG TPA: DUF2235 domain-containing protein [Bryobacteraceae bacterium]|nr:DUF2235 domain-containing protein [Bryobacteraceae bacterium]
MATKKRLAVCLDGTWNQQDSSTNVLHHYNLIYEGIPPNDTIVQKKHYRQGVGTGPLDSITGGGFGFGLEANVRDAYNWLVANFCDGERPDQDDEIYIFGFSRGAYTARSLVGFISECGLLRRGAPITVNELWSDYCILGRQKEQRTSVWDSLSTEPQAKIRVITKLAHDRWLTHPNAQICPPENEREELLIRWSRRVRITYLGVYDTVGAIGWDALAIPGLRSKMALHNNMNPTTIIQHCRHALAMDENRSSFNHTPFRAFIGNAAAEHERQRGADAPELDDHAQHWNQTIAMWNRKIEQRWFVGAHSNIGGSYEDNQLCERPLQWILEGATLADLKSEPVALGPPPAPAEQQPRDSFAEFAGGIWTKLIRAKRNYRDIDPPPLLQASKKEAAEGQPEAGFSLRNINETIDPSVPDYWKDSTSPLPPNLYAYGQRHTVSYAGVPPQHVWLDVDLGDTPRKKFWNRLFEYFALIAWASLAATGLWAIYGIIGWFPGDGLRSLISCVVAAFLVLVDWGESAQNFRQALGRGGPCGRAFLDSIYWTRLTGVVLALLGAFFSLRVLVALGWHHQVIGGTALVFLPVPVCAAVAAILCSKLGSKFAWWSLPFGPAATVSIGGFVIAAAWYFHALIRSVELAQPIPEKVLHSTPGVLLLLQLTYIYLSRARGWAAEPLNKANLGSITKLQLRFTPAAVTSVLDRWQSMLQCRWGDQEKAKIAAQQRLDEILRESLWRDMWGFIPVYSGTLLFGLWFAATYLSDVFGFLNWPGQGLALWWMIPAICAATDYLEDICHLRYVALHGAGHAPPAPLTLFSSSMSTIKDTGVTVGLLVTTGAILYGTWTTRMVSDWRPKVNILITTAFLLVAAVGVIGKLVYLIWGRKKKEPDAQPELAHRAKA